MTAAIKIFANTQALAQAVALELQKEAAGAKGQGRLLHLVLAGGGTPKAIYQYLLRPELRDSIAWEVVHFYFGDERCVVPDHQDSNYKMARDALLGPLAIAEQKIHRMRGENDPVAEASRYAGEIRASLNTPAGELPRFDWILLGLGTDGHTASIFPGVNLEEESSGICAISRHPQSGQERVTLTMDVLNRAKRVGFIATGKEKAPIVAEILNPSPNSQNYPAAHVRPNQGTLEWFLDAEAASEINK